MPVDKTDIAWATTTPGDHYYTLSASCTQHGGVQDIEIDRAEFIRLKRALAEERGIEHNLPDDDNEEEEEETLQTRAESQPSAEATIPEWATRTPNCNYDLVISTEEGDLERVEMSREEYVALKQRLAESRGYPTEDVE